MHMRRSNCAASLKIKNVVRFSVLFRIALLVTPQKHRKLLVVKKLYILPNMSCSVCGGLAVFSPRRNEDYWHIKFGLPVILKNVSCDLFSVNMTLQNLINCQKTS